MKTSVVGGVVAAVESLGAEAGGEMLRAGGNAADAAVAAAFAQGVVDPIYCGIGGGFHGLFWDAGRQQAWVVSGGGYAPRAARPDMWKPKGRSGAVWSVEGALNTRGYEAAMVPGFVRGAAEAVSRFGSGRVTWKEILAPAIRLAADGFKVYPYLYRLWLEPTEYMRGFIEGSDGPGMLGYSDESRRLYLHRDGSVYEIGETLVQTDYARTLQRIADHGADEFYEGETAHLIADDFQRNGGLLDLEDLRGYKPIVGEPIQTTFRDFEVLTETTPSVGPVTLELLNVLEGWDLKALGWNSAKYLDRLARAIHLAFRDRMTLLGDPAFVDVPLDRMLSKEYAADLRRRIESGSDLDGDVGRAVASSKAGTTHVTAVDGNHNGAAITHSIGQSSGVVTPGLGFPHNSLMESFDPVPGSRNGIEPGKRGITGGGPVLFLRDRKLALMVGSPAGARKVTAITQAFLNVVDFGMTLPEAVAAYRIHVEDVPRTVIVEPHFPPDQLVALAELGQHVRYEWYTARLAGVRVDDAGRLEGGTDPRGDRGLVVVEPSAAS
jgi:gamma-glutamyltranspeptidase / glutathione hydrolase